MENERYLVVSVFVGPLLLVGKSRLLDLDNRNKHQILKSNLAALGLLDQLGTPRSLGSVLLEDDGASQGPGPA